jgi:hypothetical protein
LRMAKALKLLGFTVFNDTTRKREGSLFLDTVTYIQRASYSGLTL